MLFAVLHDPLRELQKLLAARVQIPVIPRQLTILTIGIVVAVLGAAEFIAAADHGRTLCEYQRAPEIALLPFAQLDDLGILGGSLGAAIPRGIVIRTVAIVLAVGRV